METTINALFAHAVTRFANRPGLLEAVEDNEIITLTYSMLQQKVNDFSGYLQKQHIAKGDSIILWSASRINWMVAYLGALQVGAVIVPLDVNSKQDFVDRIANITEARFLITTQKQYTTLRQPVLPLIDIDDVPQATFDLAQLPSVNGNDLAELVFTSGTTGQPKGV